MCIKGLRLILGAASQDHGEEAPMQRIAFWTPLGGGGTGGGPGRPYSDRDVLAVDAQGGCLAVARAQKSSLLGSPPAIVRLAQRPRRKAFPTLRERMNRVGERSICIRLRGSHLEEFVMERIDLDNRPDRLDPRPGSSVC